MAKIDRYELARIRQQYASYSQQYSTQTDQPYHPDSLMQWPQNGYFNPYRKDLTLLEKAIHPHVPGKGTIAEQVFGSQLRNQRYSLRHTSNLLNERGLLHKRITRDIDHRLMQIQGELSVARMLAANIIDRDQIRLEGLVCQLEAQKRDEELAFWKDCSQIRKDLLGTALEYQDMARRAHLLSPLEAYHD